MGCCKKIISTYKNGLNDDIIFVLYLIVLLFMLILVWIFMWLSIKNIKINNRILLCCYKYLYYLKSTSWKKNINLIRIYQLKGSDDEKSISKYSKIIYKKRS